MSVELIHLWDLVFRENAWYQAKEEVDGLKTPGGYFYITHITGDKVEFIVSPTPIPKPGDVFGAFTMNRRDLEKLLKCRIIVREDKQND